MTLNMGSNIIVPFQINQTDLLAGTSCEIIAPVGGFISELGIIVQGDVTTGGDITVKVGTTDVDGLTVTVANSATKGTTLVDTPTSRHDSRKVAKGGRIQVVPAAAFDMAGSVNGYLVINTAH